MNWQYLNVKFPHIKARRFFHSIIFRVILIGLAFILVSNFVRIFFIKESIVAGLEPLTNAQQVDFSGYVAHDFAQKIQLRKEAMQRLALSLPVDLLSKPDQLQDWLSERASLLPYFSHGIFVEDAQRKIIAQYPLQAPPFRASSQAALSDTVNSATIGYVNSEVAISTLVPVGKGTSQTALRGVTSIAMPGFFDQGDYYKNGRNGGFFLTFPQDRLFITFTNPVTKPTQLMDFSSAGVDLLVAPTSQATQNFRAMQNDRGQEEIFTSASVKGTNWVVIAHFPISERDIVVERGTAVVYQAMPIILIIFLLFVGPGLYFTLRPFGRAARHADRMTRGEIPMEPMPVVYDDEVGDLTTSFNRLLNKLAEKSDELKVQKEIAETATLAKSGFLAAASHDLRQPMHALNLYLGALSHFELPEVARPTLVSARHCAQTMDNMFRTLLDISKLDAQEFKASFQTFPINSLLEEISIEFRQQILEKGLTLRVVLCSAEVVSDRELLANILRNLVSNAVRYTSHGHILIGCRRTTLGLRLAVYDTGLGIAPEQQSRIFGEFYQVGNLARDRGQGLGLGLAIVRRQAELINSPLTLISQLGRGSMFSVEVKRAIERTTKQVLSKSVTALSDEFPKDLLIAVVDDEVRILDATRLLLEQWGCTVIVATCGKDIIAQLATSSRVPDAIISDYRLRDEETGIEVIANLRSEFNADIPAILITGDTSPERISAFSSTDFTVLYKPMQDIVLKKTLSQLINLSMTIRVTATP